MTRSSAGSTVSDANALPLIVSVVHLRRVADGACGDQERNDQREGVDGEAGQPHEAEPPECGEAAGDRRPERSPPVAKVDVECDPGEDDGRPITVEASDLPDGVLALRD